MPSNTYVALDKQVLTGTASSITFSNISQAYTDLELVVNYIDAGAVNHRIVINSDSGTNYSNTTLNGNGSTAASARYSSQSFIYTDYYGGGASSGATMFAHFLNYSNTTTNKTVLIRQNSSAETNAIVGLWRSTAAITSVTVSAPGSNFSAGTTATLYGIASTSAGVKATGGIVYSDANYYYHVFNASGTFTPSTSLSCDVLTIAGGGGGGSRGGGGGGAGGFLYSAAQSMTTTAYTITIGAGGAGGTSSGGQSGAQGSNSTVTGSGFTTLTATGGGFGGGESNAGGNGGSGGGGGQNTATGSGGTGSQGFNGGGGAQGTGTGAGGGGAGANGADKGTGTGGAGSNAYSSWLSATGLGVSGSIAGGGGGGSFILGTPAAGGAGGGGAGGLNANVGSNGTVNTGGGAGGGGAAAGTGYAGGNGGSGIVVVRYAKA